MRRRASLVTGAIAVLGGSAWFGCRASDLGTADGAGAAITSGATTCRIFDNQTGQPLTETELAGLGDPIAKQVLAGAGPCPATYSEVLAKLKASDTKDCVETSVEPLTPQAQGLGSYFVSDTAELALPDKQAFTAEASAKAGYRTVISKTCNGRKSSDLLFSTFAAIDDVAETSVEVLGKDPTTGLYDFYEIIDGGQWVFYGTSADFVGSGYECGPSGFCKSLNSKKASSPTHKSCASCHIGGQPLMKEIEKPWLHWTASHVSGSESVAAKFPSLLGAQQEGQNLEFVVMNHGGISDKRVGVLAAKGVQELLRPLFCTMEINLTSSIDDPLIVLDPMLHGDSVVLDEDAYVALKKEVGQRIVGAPAGVDDVPTGFTYPSRGETDTNYVAELIQENLVDEELVVDVLDVDLTRPIFSAQRCGLVDAVAGKTTVVDAKLAAFAKAPASDPAKRATLAAGIVKDIAALYVDALKSMTTPAAKKLLKNLTDPAETMQKHRDDANRFTSSCQARVGTDARGVTIDLMTYASHLRATMRRDTIGFNGQSLLEPGPQGDDKMVVDNIPDSDTAMDPETCALTLPPGAVK